jgi:hypothetical protein
VSERIHLSAPRRSLANETAQRHRPIPLEPFGAEFRRGVQKLKGKRPNDTIRLLGRAQQDLALYESRSEMVRALSLCASAYEQAGLLWAARGSMLLAASQALKSLQNAAGSPLRLLRVRRLIWLELQLGHIACALQRIEAPLVLDNSIDQDPVREKHTGGQKCRHGFDNHCRRGPLRRSW